MPIHSLLFRTKSYTIPEQAPQLTICRQNMLNTTLFERNKQQEAVQALLSLILAVVAVQKQSVPWPTLGHNGPQWWVIVRAC